jgi:hypothetical protein
MQRSASSIVRRVLGGNEEIVCHDGAHQYGDSGQGIAGVSACGLAALNFARILFEKEQEGVRDEDFIQAVFESQTVHVSSPHFPFRVSPFLACKRTLKDITDICAGWSRYVYIMYYIPSMSYGKSRLKNSNLHLDVDDIRRVPLFERTLKLISTKYGHPGLDEFTSLLR